MPGRSSGSIVRNGRDGSRSSRRHRIRLSARRVGGSLPLVFGEDVKGSMLDIIVSVSTSTHPPEYGLPFLTSKMPERQVEGRRCVDADVPEIHLQSGTEVMMISRNVTQMHIILIFNIDHALARPSFVSLKATIVSVLHSNHPAARAQVSSAHSCAGQWLWCRLDGGHLQGPDSGDVCAARAARRALLNASAGS